MISFTTSLYISIALIVYYTVFLLFGSLMKAGQAYNSPSKVIAELRTKYKVNIRTFQKNSNHYGFATFTSIWLNENLLKKNHLLMYTFHHEHYHLLHKHKRKLLTIRYLFALTPILLSFLHWGIFTVVFLGMALAMQLVEDEFENQAHNYATKIMSDEGTEGKSGNK